MTITPTGICLQDQGTDLVPSPHPLPRLLQLPPLPAGLLPDFQTKERPDFSVSVKDTYNVNALRG